jgi:hypothetical protein
LKRGPKPPRLYLRREPAFTWASRHFDVVAYLDPELTRERHRWSAFDPKRPRPGRRNLLIPIRPGDPSCEQWGSLTWLEDKPLTGA